LKGKFPAGSKSAKIPTLFLCSKGGFTASSMRKRVKKREEASTQKYDGHPDGFVVEEK
jgi:hypothetical protein